MPCYTPFYVKHNKKEIPVPCGHCGDCLKRRIDEWSFRCYQEMRVSNTAWFVTLTYDPVTLPRTEKRFKTLRKADLQKFFKRLRYYHDSRPLMMAEIRTGPGRLKVQKKPVRYFACGEYGSQTKRPHYHAIIFNCHYGDILKAWDKGHVHVGYCSIASIRYTLKYLAKETGNQPYKGDWFDGEKQFQLQSKGLGASYLTPDIIKWHRQTYDRNYCAWPGGYKCPMPRYYAEKIWSEDERRMLRLHIHHTLNFKDVGKYDRKKVLREAKKRRRLAKQSKRILLKSHRQKL